MLDVKLGLVFLLLMYAIGPLFGCSTSPEPTTEAPAPPGKNYTYFSLISTEKEKSVQIALFLFYIYLNEVVTSITTAGPILTVTSTQELTEPEIRIGKIQIKKENFEIAIFTFDYRETPLIFFCFT